jgi:fibrillarin-like pre-rRNA processing protein
MIKKSRIFEVFEQDIKGRKQLYTVNLTHKQTVYGETLVNENGVEYREWDAFKSKLASTILKASPNVGIRKGDSILYLGAASGTTVSHVSDIVGEDGIIFAVDISPKTTRDLAFLSYKRKNIVPILANANNLDSLSFRISAVDTLFQDVAQKHQVQIFLKNIDLFLKKEGYALLAIKARSIDVTKKPKQIYKEVRSELEKHLIIIDSRELVPFQKDHCMFICKKK